MLVGHLATTPEKTDAVGILGAKLAVSRKVKISIIIANMILRKIVIGSLRRSGLTLF